MSAPGTPSEAEIRALLARILRVDLPDHPQRRSTPAWDSLKHMEIIFALEDRYDVRFDEHEFAALDSPQAICALIGRHRAA
jgi:acyl carrier protein